MRTPCPRSCCSRDPTGIGKQRLALWLAQLVFCERRGDEPCGSCRACHLVDGLSHADLHWFVPIPRPKAGDPDKQVDEAAEALAGVMEERRKQPLYTPPDGMASHSIAIGAPAPATRGADVGRRRPAGVHHRRGRPPGASGIESRGGERDAEAAGRAAAGRVVRAHDAGSAAQCCRRSGRGRPRSGSTG